MTFKNAIYFYTSYLFFLLIGSFINMIIYFYSLLGMDNISWGKTRQILTIQSSKDDKQQYYLDEVSDDYIYDEEYIRETNVRETEV